MDKNVNVLFLLGNTEIVCALLHLTKSKISLLLCYNNAVMLCHLSSPLTTVSQTQLKLCALYGVHRANTMYCSFTNKMLKVPFLPLQHRELPPKKNCIYPFVFT